MASSTDGPARQTFAIWAPDYTDPDALQRRLAARAEHSERVKRLTAEGFLKIAGPISDLESGRMNGSLLIAEAESGAAVRAVLEEDAYWVNGVWDKEKLDIRAINIVIDAR